MSFRRIGVVLLGASAVVAASSVVLVTSQGLPNRLPAEAARINAAVGTHYRCEVSRLFPFGASRACDLTLGGQGIEVARIALVGNSHAQMYAPILRQYGQEKDIPIALVPLNACLPTVTSNINGRCLNQAKQNLASLLQLPNLETVVISHNWPIEEDLVAPGGAAVDAEDEVAKATVSLADQFKEAGVEVIIVGPILRPLFPVASILSRQIAFGHEDRVPNEAPRQDWTASFESSVKIIEASGHAVIRPDLVQCNAETCEFVGDQGSLFADGGHLSQLALPLFKSGFVNAIDSVSLQ